MKMTLRQHRAQGGAREGRAVRQILGQPLAQSA